MRNPAAVIDEILKEIPSEEIELIKELKDLIESFSYKAPEQIMMCFGLIGDTLSEYIPEYPKKEWQFKVLSRFSMISVEDIKKAVKEQYGEQNKE